MSTPKLFQDAWQSTRDGWASDESEGSASGRRGSGIIVFLRRISSSRVGKRSSLVEVDVNQPTPNIAPRRDSADGIHKTTDGIEKEQPTSSRWWRAAQCILLTAALGATIGSAFYFLPLLSSKGSSSQSTTEREESWIDIIQSASPSTQFDNATSPQRKALDRMLREDNIYAKTPTTDLNGVERQFLLQRFALLTFLYGIGFSLSDHSSVFLPRQSRHVCEWTEVGVGCDAQQVATSLLLSGSVGVADGVLPPELGILTGLTSLDLSHNDLVGTIPTEVGQLIRLEELKLSQNRFGGPLPTNELSALTNLVTLHLHDNPTLTGSIPWHLCVDAVNLTEVLIDCGNLACDCCENGGSGNDDLCDASVVG